MSVDDKRRIIVVDDNPAIHEDFNRILCGDQPGEDLGGLEQELFGIVPKEIERPGDYELLHASQGEEAVEIIRQKAIEGCPVEVAFVDMRMPPGWDGMETIKRIWDIDPEVRAIICTAYTDHSHEELIRELGVTDKLLILKKPMDVIEVAQLASAMTTMWRLRKRELRHMQKLRGYASEKSAEVRDIKERLEEERRLHTQFEAEVSRYKLRLSQKDQQWQLLFHAIQAPLAVLSPEGLMVQVNRAFQRLCRADQLDVDGRSWDQVIATDPPLGVYLKQIELDKKPRSETIRIVDASTDLLVNLIPVLDAEDGLHSILTIFVASSVADIGELSV
ncbi:hypothetical protein BVY04_01570 [bacterium M21]|nr:hypothetical protein BVY04_01570 [bacterium M21]